MPKREMKTEDERYYDMGNYYLVLSKEEDTVLRKTFIREFLENNTTTEILMLKSNYEYIQEKKELKEE